MSTTIALEEAQREHVKMMLACIVHTFPCAVDKLLPCAEHLRVRTLSLQGVSKLVNKIIIRWDPDSVISVYEDPSDNPDLTPLHKLIEDAVAADAEFKMSDEWLRAHAEVEKRKFRYLDGNHRLHAVHKVNEIRTGRGQEGQLLTFIPKIRLYHVPESSGVSIFDIASWLNAQADNVEYTNLDKLYSLRKPVP